MRQLPAALLSIAVALIATTVSAQVKLPAIFSDNMVLQRDMPVPFWGWDKPGAKVSVAIGETSVEATAAEDGKWSLSLPAMSAGGPHTVTVTGSDEKKIRNVLVGEVWLCSGQSNMEWTVGSSANATQEIANAKFPRIRHIKIPRRPAESPAATVDAGPWQEASPKTAGSFTAVGYYFARYLHKELGDIPIGLIGSNWGGTRVEPWTPKVGFQKTPALKSITDNLNNFPQKRNDGSINHQSPLALYNGMIHPLVPFAIRGALWYQGESNNGEGLLYFEKKKALIEGWRSVWNRPEMPFYFVQLAPYQYGGDADRLAFIWDAQRRTLSLPHTGMAVTTDIGNLKNIHPTNKQDVGKRLALWALAKNYGKEDLVYSGPLYKSMKVEGNTVRLSFDHIGGGLAARGKAALTEFMVAGEDKKFVAAKAAIDGETIVVSAAGVQKPVAVRYAFSQTSQPKLINKEGLPASPFRTDDW